MKESPYKSYDDLPLMLSVPQVAAVLGISRAGFPSLTIGSRIVIPKDRLIAWINEKTLKNQ